MSLLNLIDEKKAKKLYIIVAALVTCAAILVFIKGVFPYATTARTTAWFAVILAMLLAMIGFFTFMVIREKKFTYSMLFVVVTIGWTLIYQMIIPPVSGTDEHMHYGCAYYVSDMILGTTDTTGLPGDEDVEDGLVMRYEDALKWVDVDCKYPDSYKVLSGSDFFATKDNQQLMVANMTYYKMWIRYIPSGIGIALGRLLGLGFTPTIYLGRLMNTIMFLLLGLLALKLLPVGRMQMVSIAMIPLFIQETASLSYDAISNTLCIFVAAYCLHLSQEETKIRIWDVLVLMISFILLIPNKGVYIAFAIMLFMVPIKRWLAFAERVCGSRKRMIIIIAVFVVLVVLLGIKLSGNFIGYFRAMFRDTGAVIEQDPTRLAWTLGYAVKHPYATAMLWWQTFGQFGFYYVRLMLGEKLANLNLEIEVPENYIVILFAIMMIQMRTSWLHGKMIDRRRRIIWNITLVATMLLICFGCMVRFTPIDTDVLQLSGRYILPIFASALLVYGTDEEENPRTLRLLAWQNLAIVPIAINVLQNLAQRPWQ